MRLLVILDLSWQPVAEVIPVKGDGGPPRQPVQLQLWRDQPVVAKVLAENHEREQLVAEFLDSLLNHILHELGLLGSARGTPTGAS